MTAPVPCLEETYHLHGAVYFWTDLHIIIENGVLISIEAQEPLRIRYAKVLEVKKAVWEMFPH